jgi:hypothetical protein
VARRLTLCWAYINKGDSVTKTEKQILDNVRKLELLEREFKKFNYETATPRNSDESISFLREIIRIAGEAFTTRNKILEDFKDVTELNIQDKQALGLLDSVRRNDKLYSIAFYENVGGIINADAENQENKMPTSIEDILNDKFEDIFSDFHSWFDVTSYYLAQITIGPIISSFKIPSYLLSYFTEIKETYAFGKYRASVALCRALLEMALYRKLKAKGAFRDKDPKVTGINVAREDNLNRYINMAKWEKVLSKDSLDLAHQIRKTANGVLHIKDSEKQLNKKIVVDTIFATLRILEGLYR